MTQIYPDLYQFTDVIEPIKLSMHQYLLLTDEPVLRTCPVSHCTCHFGGFCAMLR